MKITSKLANRDLKKERDLNREFFLTSPAFVVAVGTDGKIEMMNDAMCNSLGPWAPRRFLYSMKFLPPAGED